MADPEATEVGATPPPEDADVIEEAADTTPPPEAVTAPPAPEPTPAPPAPETPSGLAQRFKESVMKVLGDVVEKATPWVEKATYIASWAAEFLPGAAHWKIALLTASGGLWLATGKPGEKIGMEFSKKHPRCAELFRRFGRAAFGGGISGLALRWIANLLYPGLVENGINTANDVLAGGAKEAGHIYGEATKVGLPKALAKQAEKVTGISGIETGVAGVGKAVETGIKPALGAAKDVYAQAAPLKPLGEAVGVTGGLWIGARLVRGFKKLVGLEKAVQQPPESA